MTLADFIKNRSSLGAGHTALEHLQAMSFTMHGIMADYKIMEITEEIKIDEVIEIIDVKSVIDQVIVDVVGDEVRIIEIKG